MSKKDVYRACASLVVLRPAAVCAPDGCGTVYEMLLLHKPRKRDSWQLPQGGVEEGETLEQAAARELQEEAGLAVEILGRSAREYRYDFPASYRRFRPDNVCGQCVGYVFAVPAPDAPVTVDAREVDAYVWVLPEDLPRYIRRPEYLSLVHHLYGEGVDLLQKA